MSNCVICGQKLRSLVIDMNTCRCGGVYCREHLHTHQCKFDYHEQYRLQTEKVLVPIVAEKVVRF